MEKRRKNILVTIDSSRQSIDAADYISAMLDPCENSVVLFHVECDVFDIFYDYDEIPKEDIPDKSHFSEWMNIQRRNIDENLEKASRFFLNRGFEEEHVKIVKRPVGKGVSRDILAESQKGYDLLVTGKSGANRASGLLTGTVTTKLLSRTFHIPFVIVTGAPDTRKVLVGYDGSKGADKAVKGAAGLLRTDLDEVQLCHVIRSFNQALSQKTEYYTTFYNSYLPELEEALVRIRREKMEPLVNKACLEFVKKGFLPSKVRWSMVNRMASRSQALIDMASAQECGTMVLGRRGNSAVEEFFMGRVGKKAIQMADSLAIWIV